MPEIVDRVLTELRGEYGQKAFKYLAVSAFNVIFGQGLLLVCQVVFEFTAVWANLFAVTVSAFPAYYLSRRWIWQKRGKSHFLKEVVPFWSLAFLGLLLSTGAVHLVESRWDPTPIVINLTNLASFGALWVVKFFVLDQLLFNAGEPITDDALDALVDDVLHHRGHDPGE